MVIGKLPLQEFTTATKESIRIGWRKLQPRPYTVTGVFSCNITDKQ